MNALRFKFTSHPGGVFFEFLFQIFWANSAKNSIFLVFPRVLIGAESAQIHITISNFDFIQRVKLSLYSSLAPRSRNEVKKPVLREENSDFGF